MEGEVDYIGDEQKRIAKIVTEKFRSYYLTGGTALAFYFRHRFSEDLDFFTQEYRKDDSDRIMDFVSSQTGFGFKLEHEQSDPKLVPMKIYFLELTKGNVLKMDFVQDFQKNLKEIKNRMHSVEDIYFRKIIAAVVVQQRESITGQVIAGGRQAAKDLFDIYYLSCHYKPVSDFFLEFFSVDKAQGLIAWYRGFNQMKLKLELLDLVEGVDPGEVRRHLDEEILRKLPDRLIG